MILNPDDHPERWTKPSEAFAHVARTLRDVVLKDPEVKRVMVMVGGPGSGKSTWAKEHDDEAVLDACHASAKTRRELARRIRAAGKQAIAVWMNTPLEVAIRRNNRRDPPRRVPSETIRRQHRELEKRPPRPVEGWGEVIEVVP